MIPQVMDNEILSETDTNIDEDKLDSLLLELVKEAEKDDEQVRYRLVQQWKRNTYYFNNLQKFFYDDVARDYRTLDSALAEMEKYAPTDDIKTVNIYRAFAESIIAALSVSTPNIEFFPDDAEVPEDIQTAEAYTRIAGLIKKHNQAELLLIKALTILYNQGVAAAYNYYEENPSYGITRIPKEAVKKEIKINDLRCPNCSELVESNVPSTLIQQGLQIKCMFCGYEGNPLVNERLDYVDEVTRWEDTPKGRTKIDIFGPTYVKLPLNARDQASCGYLILRLDDDVAKFKTVYKDLASEITAGGGDTYRYERWGRIPPEYFGTMPINITTLRIAWFRPWYYNRLRPEDAEVLFDKFPNGVKVDVIDELVLEKHHENLDDRWTLSFDPRSDYVHSEPPGNALVPMQDAENDLFNLGLQCIEYGIPETFVHPKTLNLQKYKESPNSPGMMSPALPPSPDKSLADGFHTIRAATLSNEYINFEQQLTSKTQFVTGGFPSIYGGAIPSSGGTASEYSQSRAQALQRLQIVWQMISVFWSRMMAKAVRMYANNLRGDERYTDKKNGTYVNVWIYKSSLQGKIGHVEPEVNSQLPQSWAQQRDFFMRLVELNVPEVGEILLDPNNTELLKKVSGMPEFYVPGEHDRNKQWQEFYTMSTEGIQVDIDISVDDHKVHMRVLKNILVSPQGLALYENNPASYSLCIEHYRRHEIAFQSKSAMPSGDTMLGESARSAIGSVEG